MPVKSAASSAGWAGRPGRIEVVMLPSEVTPLNAADTPKPEPGFFRRHVLFPAHYTWFVFFASLDVMCTWIVVHFEGFEANPVAAWVIRRFDLPGAVALKFGAVVLVIAICEIVGRRRAATGRKLAEWSVAVSVIPVVLALWQLARDTLEMVRT